MKTGIVIVSGFLGAGKTTLIQKLIRDSFRGQRVALIENDFGEIGVDAALLGAGGLEVREINSGCICCTLTGDFVRALRELLERYRPEEVIIEPSGLGNCPTSSRLAAIRAFKIWRGFGTASRSSTSSAVKCIWKTSGSSLKTRWSMPISSCSAAWKNARIG
jgi:Ni2+-binding GTPase involved in maturation of urease and hydrogenase